MKKIVIFCQAPADVPFVLTIYRRNKNSKISIYVVNVKGVFDFINSLNLRLYELNFIPYSNINFRNPYLILKERIRIRRLLSKHFQERKDIVVYFFSRFEDWLTSSFLHCLANNSVDIFYVNHYDISANSHPILSNIKFSRKILRFIFRFITGVDFLMTREFKFPEFPINNYEIQEIEPEIDEAVFNEFSYNSIRCNLIQRQVLFFISPPEQDLYDNSYYENRVKEIIDFLKQFNFKIYIKGHPRVGLPDFLSQQYIDKNKIEIIPAGIPGEFINLNNVNLCLGIDSTIISLIAKNTDITTYCLANLFKPNNTASLEYLKKYLLDFSEQKLNFINSINHLKILLQNDPSRA